MTAPRARKSGSFTSETRAACSRFVDLGPGAGESGLEPRGPPRPRSCSGSDEPAARAVVPHLVDQRPGREHGRSPPGRRGAELVRRVRWSGRPRAAGLDPRTPASAAAGSAGRPGGAGSPNPVPRSTKSSSPVARVPERCRSPRGPTCVAALVGSPILLPPRPAEGGIAPPLDDTIRYALLVELAIRRAGPRPTNFPRLAGGPPLTACWKFVNVTYCVRLSER